MSDEELIARLRKADEYEPLGHDGWEAADRIEALVKARREDALELLAAHGQAQDAYEAQLKAEAQNAALTARVERLTGALEFYAEDGWKDRPLDPPTPEEVEVFGDNILDFPMPEVFFDRGERARAALTETATTEEGK